MKLSRDYPHAAGFMYDRYNTEVTTHLNPNKFSLSSLIDSSEIRDEWEDGKSVYNPERVFTAWIHWPGLTHQPGYKMQLVSSEQNIMVHMRKWKMVSHINVISMRGSRSDFIANGLPLTHFQGPPDAQSSTKKKLKSKPHSAFDLRIRDIISPEKTRLLQLEFNRTFAQTREFQNLPIKVRYYPLIADCYQKIFYDKSKQPDSCPGPVNCFLPPMPDVKCSIAKGNFVYNKVNDGLFVHYPAKSRFIVHSDGCDMLP
ncbi:hypothetical protein L596_004407 [Steinernema carpocapsae]|uniref:Glycosyltransferase family 92 protein n=1 Tax=Steinernema carpocapsae TaxID=34508 RepID=A0A4U8UVT7_STECR|nr:hypothetical protein L596_004407 [Steinernema carpocapsae]